VKSPKIGVFQARFIKRNDKGAKPTEAQSGLERKKDWSASVPLAMSAGSAKITAAITRRNF
jgi:hypothetical protein